MCRCVQGPYGINAHESSMKHEFEPCIWLSLMMSESLEDRDPRLLFSFKIFEKTILNPTQHKNN